MKFEIALIGETNPDFLSRMIQKHLTRDAKELGLPTPILYSHALILVDDVVVYHATGKGFHKSTLAKELAEDSVVRRRWKFKLDDTRTAFAIGWLEAKIHSRIEYSDAQYLGFMFKFMRACKFVSNDGRQTICSEIVADFLKICCGVRDPLLDDTDFVSPLHIEMVCNKYGVPQ